MAKLDQEMKKVREKYSDDLWLIVFRIEIEKDGERKVKMSKSCPPRFNIHIGSHENLIERCQKLEVIAKKVELMSLEEMEAIEHPAITSLKNKFQEKMMIMEEKQLQIQEKSRLRIQPKK